MWIKIKMSLSNTYIGVYYNNVQHLKVHFSTFQIEYD